MTSKRLLICSPSVSLHGGVEAIIGDLCREMPRFGWEPLLALGKGYRFNNVEAYRACHPELSCKDLDGTSGTRASRLHALSEMIKKVQPDLVISARMFDVYEAVSLLKQKKGIPRLVTMVRGYEPHYLFDLALYRDNIDLCVVDGDLLAAACRNWSGVDHERVVSIPGGIRPPAGHVSPRKRSEILRIGYVGRLADSDKRVMELVPFVNKLDAKGFKYTLTVVGEGPEEVVLRKELSSQFLEGRVEFLGWKRNDELYEKIYPNLDCLVNFSATEGVTISGREGMVHGVVSVIACFTGLKTEAQYVSEVNCLVFPVGNIEAAANCIERLSSEPDLLQRLSKNAIRSQFGKYTFAGSMKAWAEALDRCLFLPPKVGPVPKLNIPPDGRLTRMGLPPPAAQRIRDILGIRHLHRDPGSEWPTGSGTMPPAVAKEILDFAFEWEKQTVPTEPNRIV